MWLSNPAPPPLHAPLRSAQSLRRRGPEWASRPPKRHGTPPRCARHGAVYPRWDSNPAPPPLHAPLRSARSLRRRGPEWASRPPKRHGTPPRCARHGAVYPRWDSNPHLSDFKSPASAIGLRGRALISDPTLPAGAPATDSVRTSRRPSQAPTRPALASDAPQTPRTRTAGAARSTGSRCHGRARGCSTNPR